MTEYLVIVEKIRDHYSAYVPDLPGCVTTGPTLDSTLANIQEAIEFHLEGMREDGQQIPESTSAAYIVSTGRLLA